MVCYANPLTVKAVQWEMGEQYITDQQQFWDDVEIILDDSTEGALVVFPEYTSVFLALDSYGHIIERHDDFLSAWNEISSVYGHASIRELFIKESLYIHQMLYRWQQLAREYRCYIIPGSFFTYDFDQKALVNRTVVIDPSGTTIYSQDKVFCTPFEEYYCGIEGAAVEDAAPFMINGQKIALTLCRDTFFKQWDPQMGRVDLWIDIKANGAAYDLTEQQRFERGVPVRIKNTGSRYGLTLCLTGSLFDLFWEGESSLKETSGLKVIASETTREYDHFSFVID